MRSRMSSAAFPEIANAGAMVSVVQSSSRFDLKGRVALVTGASRGIGSAISEALAEQGAQVVLSSRKQTDLDDEAARINTRFPEQAVGIAAHAGRPEDLQRLVEEVMKRFGRIDILVKLVYEASMAQHGGAIVNVSSVGGLRPGLGLGVYNITKAGVIMLTRQLARELGPKVRVNAVAPGLVKTRFAEALWGNEAILDRVVSSNPMGRIGVPDEIAGAVVFLVSDAASYVNGEVLVIDGGGGEP